MKKPDGSPHGIQHHHYALHLAHTWHCEHTCKADQPSVHRPHRAGSARAHTNPNFHANIKELATAPSPERSRVIAQELIAEIMEEGRYYRPDLYAAIWNQAQSAIASIS